jgi:hypothetical protein
MRKRMKQSEKEASRSVDLTIDDAQYFSVLQYLFDRDTEAPQEWYWNQDETPFAASDLDWIKLQHRLFTRCEIDLKRYTDEQVGMGLNYLINPAISNVPSAIYGKDVPAAARFAFIESVPAVWAHCIGPRLAFDRSPIGSGAGKLYFVGYMWFDVGVAIFDSSNEGNYADATWSMFKNILDQPYRICQIGALHGLGHYKEQLNRNSEFEKLIDEFLQQKIDADPELASYARAAKTGSVQ